jgi:hypothetical protein
VFAERWFRGTAGTGLGRPDMGGAGAQGEGDGAAVGVAARVPHGRATVTATSTPKASPASAMAMTPALEVVWESSSMATVEKTTVAEP